MFIEIAHAAEEVTATSPNPLDVLGINWSAFLFQLANFGILLWLLKRYAYRPVMKVLEERRMKIIESLRNADHLKTAKEKIEQERLQILQAAREQAQDIIHKSQTAGLTIVAEAKDKADEVAARIKEQADARLRQDTAIVRTQLKKEAIMLVALVTEKVVGQNMNNDTDKAVIERALAQVELEREVA